MGVMDLIFGNISDPNLNISGVRYRPTRTFESLHSLLKTGYSRNVIRNHSIKLELAPWISEFDR